MAGTPTTNYNIPTYADTDAPDLSGAYNDAMGIIDTQLKTNADATAAKQDKLTAGSGIEIQGNEISATATGGTEYTAGNGILINGETISNKQATHVDSTNITSIESGTIPANYIGGVKATATNADVIDRLAAIDDAEHGYAGAAVPTVKALKGYVEQKMAAAGAAYTGTAPIIVNNDTREIRITAGTDISFSDGSYTAGSPGVVVPMNSDATVNFFNTGDLPPSSGGPLMVSGEGVRAWVLSRTPDATTSMKGLVQLATGHDVNTSSAAITPAGVTNMMQHLRDDRATQTIDVQALAGRLFVDTATGLVFYKAPTE